MEVRFPMPFSDTIRRSHPWESSCMPITSSRSARFIPLTPMEVLPVGRTSFSSNRMHCPYFVTRSTSLSLSVYLTSINSSSSRSVIAASPVFLTCAYSVIGVFLTSPFLVAMNRYSPSLYSSIGITALIFSPGINCRRLTIAVPLEVRLASGISYPFIRYTLPVLVKNMI